MSRSSSTRRVSNKRKPSCSANISQAAKDSIVSDYDKPLDQINPMFLTEDEKLELAATNGECVSTVYLSTDCTRLDEYPVEGDQLQYCDPDHSAENPTIAQFATPVTTAHLPVPIDALDRLDFEPGNQSVATEFSIDHATSISLSDVHLPDSICEANTVSSQLDKPKFRSPDLLFELFSDTTNAATRIFRDDSDSDVTFSSLPDSELYSIILSQEYDDIFETSAEVEKNLGISAYRDPTVTELKLYSREFAAAKLKELQSWQLNRVFTPIALEEITSMSENPNLITARWLLKVKENSQNEICKFKARLVVRGFLDQEKDVVEKDSPTVNKISFRLLILYAITHNYSLNTVDIKTAFLQGKPYDTKRLVFTQPPNDANELLKLPPDMIWKLLKPAYGLARLLRLARLNKIDLTIVVPQSD